MKITLISHCLPDMSLNARLGGCFLLLVLLKKINRVRYLLAPILWLHVLYLAPTYQKWPNGPRCCNSDP